jgi:hypothetical protein
VGNENGAAGEGRPGRIIFFVPFVPFVVQSSSAKDERRAAYADSVNFGSRTISPPFMADSWAQRPTHVQLADCTALG